MMSSMSDKLLTFPLDQPTGAGARHAHWNPVLHAKRRIPTIRRTLLKSGCSTAILRPRVPEADGTRS